MSWLAQLDTRAKRTPPLAYGLYLVCKWGLVALGAFALGGVLLDRIGIWSLY